MQDARNIDLDRMSVRELLALQEHLRTAIRAAIRQKNEGKTAAGAVAAPLPKPTIDLARERDAWLAARKRGT